MMKAYGALTIRHLPNVQNVSGLAVQDRPVQKKPKCYGLILVGRNIFEEWECICHFSNANVHLVLNFLLPDILHLNHILSVISIV